MIRKVIFSLLMIQASSSGIALAYDCNSNCSEVGHFRYPCPTFNNPGRMCDGNDPIRINACHAQKTVSCDLWEGAVDFFAARVKPIMQGEFNASVWQQAVVDGTEDRYLALCMAAGISACSAVGAQVGGPWGAVISGAGGTFVSYRICEQSKSW